MMFEAKWLTVKGRKGLFLSSKGTPAVWIAPMIPSPIPFPPRSKNLSLQISVRASSPALLHSAPFVSLCLPVARTAAARSPDVGGWHTARERENRMRKKDRTSRACCKSVSLPSGRVRDREKRGREWARWGREHWVSTRESKGEMRGEYLLYQGKNLL